MTYDKEIQKLQRKIAGLKARSAKFDAHRKKTALRRVASLLKKLGYDSIQELLEIADTVAVVTTSKTRKRAKVTDSLRKSVVAALKSNRTSAVVAKTHKVSVATVNSIKAKAGLTKSRKVTKTVKAKRPAKKKAAVKSIKRPRKGRVAKKRRPKSAVRNSPASVPAVTEMPSSFAAPI